MARIRALLMGGVALVLLGVPAAQAQTPDAPPAAPGASASEDPCAVVPGGASPDAPPADGDAVAGPSDGSLSETLERCGGVLSPPAVGDPGMVEPAPDEGVTPVIPPSAVPQAQ